MPPLLICVLQFSVSRFIFFSDIFKDSLKVLSQCYKRKPTKMAGYVNAVNCIRVQDSQTMFFLQGLSCFRSDCLSN